MNELYLQHHGILGQKWGVRRYQNPDGTLTAAGKKRYDQTSDTESDQKTKLTNEQKAKIKKAAKIGAVVVGTALAAYGTYKAAEYVQTSRNTKAFYAAHSYVRENAFVKLGQSTFDDDSTETVYRSRNVDGKYTQISVNKRANGSYKSEYDRSKEEAVDYHNEFVMKNAEKIYNETRKTGSAADKITSAGKAAKVAANNASKKVKNTVLDAIDPKYEYDYVTKSSSEPVDLDGAKGTVRSDTTYRIKRKVKRA